MTATTPDIRSVRARRTLLEKVRRTLASAPVSAWFGMIVILIYAFAAIFAPWFRPLAIRNREMKSVNAFGITKE